MSLPALGAAPGDRSRLTRTAPILSGGSSFPSEGQFSLQGLRRGTRPGAAGELSPSAGLKYSEIPNGLGAISKVPALGWAQMAAWVGATEFLAQQSKTDTPGARDGC